MPTTRAQERRSLNLINGTDTDSEQSRNGSPPALPKMDSLHTPANGTGGQREAKPTTARSPLPLPIWVMGWLIVSGFICAFDAFFTSWRPHTLPKGWMGNFILCKGWHIYAAVDKRYADTSDVLTLANGRLMILEIILNFLAVFLAYRRNRHSVVIAFTTSVMVVWKTMLYWFVAIAPPPGAKDYLGHNKSGLKVFAFFWALNGIWVIVPAAIVAALWPRLLPKAKAQ